MAAHGLVVLVEMRVLACAGRVQTRGVRGDVAQQEGGQFGLQALLRALRQRRIGEQAPGGGEMREGRGHSSPLSAPDGRRKR